jgi:hypothetical protein
MLRRWISVNLVILAALALAACSSDDSNGGSENSDFPAQACVGRKQGEAAAYCRAVLDAWAKWETSQDANERNTAIADARATLRAAWSEAEADAAAQGSNCSDLALTADQAGSAIDDDAAAIAEDVNRGLNLGDRDDATCGRDLLAAVAQACESLLAAEGDYLANVESDPHAAQRDASQRDALDKLADDYADATGDGCTTQATESQLRAAVSAASDDLVAATVVAANLDSAQYTTISPTGTTEYRGKAITPVCMDGSPYHFFVKRGTVNKVLMYYQGGGACWEYLTCSIPVCDDNVNPDGNDNPNNFSSGFADAGNPDNPFRDWNVVFVAYCGCDIHFGDMAQDYPSPDGSSTLHIEHRGYHNAQFAEKWAREHFVNPEQIFVTGSSAGAYGAWFNAPLLHEAWPGSRFDVLADAGNGVITNEFLQEFFPNWNFAGNLPPDIPEIKEVLDNGSGIPGYTEVIANRYPDTDWAHYSAAYDGGSGGQTGFFNLMLNDNNPVAALSWWQGSCEFNRRMRQQSMGIYDAVPENYRYYIGTGSQHTMWGSNKVYTDTTGGVPTIVDWVNAMLDSGPDGRDPDWTNVECTDCGLLLENDVRPDPLQAPFEQQGDDVRIVCEE